MNAREASVSQGAKRGGFRTYVLGVIVVAAVLIALAFVIVRTSPVRGAVQSYMRLVAASNRGDVETVKALCTERFLQTARLNEDGGRVLGEIPQVISQNFQGWEEDGAVLFSPGARVGPVYRLLREGDRWLFDGTVGVLRGDGTLDRTPESPKAPAAPAPVDSQGASTPQ